MIESEIEVKAERMNPITRIAASLSILVAAITFHAEASQLPSNPSVGLDRVFLRHI